MRGVGLLEPEVARDGVPRELRGVADVAGPSCCTGLLLKRWYIRVLREVESRLHGAELAIGDERVSWRTHPDVLALVVHPHLGCPLT